MRILDKLKKISHRETGVRDFCIQTIRFKKFLENARALLDFFEDGREKVHGEYIFDRHYVVSLIDGIVERLGMMVYDACILVPENGQELYATYDKHKLTAANLIGSGASGSMSAETNEADDPEYQLLSDVLRWFDGAAATEEISVMDFMKQIFFYVIQGLETVDRSKNRTLFENSNVLAADRGIYLIDLWKDALALPKEKRASSDFNSIPLKHLLMDAGGRDAKAGAGDIQTNGLWVAAVSEYQLSLNALNQDFQFRLETLASGYEQSDFIFVFADKTAALDTILPAGFHVENSNYGQFAWNLDVSAKTIEDSLMIIGRNLFG